MKKKLPIILSILIVGGLFAYGVKSFIQEYGDGKSIYITREAPESLSDAKSDAKKEKTENIFAKNKAGILQNIIKNPVIEAFKTLVGGQTEEREKNQNDDLENTVKNALENYFSKSARVNFPEYELVAQAITLQKQGKSEALETVIYFLEEAGRSLYAINPPEEAKEIHKNSLWINTKFIELLGKISKTTEKQEILDIINGSEMKEIKEITDKTKEEMELLVKEYNLKLET